MSASIAYPKCEETATPVSSTLPHGGFAGTTRFRPWDGLLCGCFVVLVILCSYPFAEMGFIDDWSYIKTAQDFANTGHFVYNGWATAMLGWQVPWGAIFIKLFGFSFTAARISNLISTIATIWLFYAILERFGVERRNAIFGCVMLGCSPLFLPLAPSFMTDINGLMVILLCAYMCMRALVAASNTSAFSWLAIAALTNVMGGTVRQIAWLGTLVLLPSTVWLMRRRRGMLLAGTAIWTVGAAGVFFWMQWWQHQPNSVPEKIFDSSLWAGFSMLPHIGIRLVRGFFCLGLLLLPLLAGWSGSLRRLTRRAWIAGASFTGLLVVAGVILHRQGKLDLALMPWLTDVLAALGTASANLWMLGSRPILDVWVRAVISLAVVVTASAFVLYLFAIRDSTDGTQPRDPSMPWQTILVFWGPFTLAYIGLLLPRIAFFLFLDRYLLGLMPVAILCLLRLHQDRVKKQLPLVSYALLVVFSIYTVAATHDWYALQRARIDAGSELISAGVPATGIQGGADYDGWTQINLGAPINVANIDLPDRSELPKPCYYNFSKDTPAITPQYFVVLEDLPCLKESGFKNVNYRAWLPPFRRALYIQKRP